MENPFSGASIVLIFEVLIAFIDNFLYFSEIVSVWKCFITMSSIVSLSKHDTI